MAVQPGELVLASGSTFRRQMLEQAGLKFRVVVAEVDEAAARADMMRETPDMGAGEIALRLAQLKALEVSARCPGALVIGADQVLVLGTTIFAKPTDRAEARRQLVDLRGHTHRLPTAVVLARDGAIHWHHISTATLTMRDFSDAFLDAYLTAAGSVVTLTVGCYQLEGLGAQLLDRVEGDYFTVIGLPLMPLLEALRDNGFLLR